MSSVLCGCQVVVLYCRSISGTRYQVLDTAHTRSISGYVLRLLPVVMVEYFILIMRVYWYSTWNVSCTRSNLGGYCKLTCCLLRCCYCCCFCSAAAGDMAAAAHSSSSGDAVVLLLLLLLSLSCEKERPSLLHKRRLQ